MRLTLDDEPTGDEIQNRAHELFGYRYRSAAWWRNIYKDDHCLAVDMECVAEQQLIRERVAAKQQEFA